MQFTKKEISEGRTYYSNEFDGDDGNYDWSATVDVTAPGYVRIVQKDEHGTEKDTVLLSPQQWDEIVSFVRNGPVKRDAREAALAQPGSDAPPEERER